MARSIWTGSISFGLVNIPVRLYTATQSHDIGFHQLERDTGQRIRYKRVGERTGREVEYADIVKGYELKKGRFVMIAPEELETAEPKKTRTIEIEEFVGLDEIDPIVWDHTYFVGPDDAAASQKAYGLLRAAMDDTGKVGIGRFVMREKEYLVTVRPLAKGLALETMYFADEIRKQDEVPNLPAKRELPKKELDLAKQLIGSLTGSWDHRRYRDTFRDRVMDLIQMKAKGKEIEAAPPADEPADVVDLMEALKQSLNGGGRRTAARATARRRTRAPAIRREKRPRTRAATTTRSTRKTKTAGRKARARRR